MKKSYILILLLAYSLISYAQCDGRYQTEIFDEITRILKPGGLLNILDIRLSYQPNIFMLAGEPFLNDYLNNFANEINNLPFEELEKPTYDGKQLDKLFVKL